MRKSSAKRIAVFLISLSILFGSSSFVSAETNWEKLKQKEKELDLVDSKIDLLDQSIKKKNSEVKTLEKEVEILQEGIEKTNLEIDKTRISIEQMEINIKLLQKQIEQKEAVILHKKNSLKEFLRIIYENDNTTFLEKILSDSEWSDIWANLEAMQRIQGEIQNTLENLKEEKSNLENDRLELEKKQEEQDELFAMQETQKAALESDRTRKDNFIKKARYKKTELEKNLNDAERSKKILREEIFLLKNAGVSMSMQQALEYARFAASKTGIRPEFLLGLLKVESDLGNNVGTGYYRTDMNPNQHEAFFIITRKLSLDPEIMPVSKKPSSYKGWGGAMGPAQMMPKTWLGYEAEIARLTGSSLPSPWNNRDAFTAAAAKLSRDGASSQRREDEWKAAMLYLAGSNWSNPNLRWYGDRVLKLAEVYGS